MSLRMLLVLPFLGLVACGPAVEVERQSTESAIMKRTDAELRTEIETLANGLLYMSEGDYPFTFVSAPLVRGERMHINEALIRAKLASFVDGDPEVDGPLADLYGEVISIQDWQARFDDCSLEDYPDCAGIRALNEFLEHNLWGEKVFIFGRSGEPGQVEGVAVTIFIVGRSPDGNLVGVRTVAIWT